MKLLFKRNKWILVECVRPRRLQLKYVGQTNWIGRSFQTNALTGEPCLRRQSKTNASTNNWTHMLNHVSGHTVRHGNKPNSEPRTRKAPTTRRNKISPKQCLTTPSKKVWTCRTNGATTTETYATDCQHDQRAYFLSSSAKYRMTPYPSSLRSVSER